MAGERLGPATAVRSAASIEGGGGSLAGKRASVTLKSFGEPITSIRQRGFKPVSDRGFESVRPAEGVLPTIKEMGSDLGINQPAATETSSNTETFIPNLSAIPKLVTEAIQSQVVAETTLSISVDPKPDSVLIPEVKPIPTISYMGAELGRGEIMFSKPGLQEAKVLSPEVPTHPIVEVPQNNPPNPYDQQRLARRLRTSMNRLVGAKAQSGIAVNAQNSEILQPQTQSQTHRAELTTQSSGSPTTIRSESGQQQKSSPEVAVLTSSRRRRRSLAHLSINRDPEIIGRRTSSLENALVRIEERAGQVEAEELITESGIMGDDFKSRIGIPRDGSQSRITKDLMRNKGRVNKELVRTIVSDHPAIIVGDGGSDGATHKEIWEVLTLPDAADEVTISEATLRRQIIREETVPMPGNSSVVYSEDPSKITAFDQSRTEYIIETPISASVERAFSTVAAVIFPASLDDQEQGNIVDIRRELIF